MTFSHLFLVIHPKPMNLPKMPNKNTSYQLLGKVVIHIIFWLIALQILFDLPGLYYSFNELFSEEIKEIDDAFLLTFIFIGLFYWNSEFLVPKLLDKKSWWIYLIGLIISYFFFILLAQVLFQSIESFVYPIRYDLEDFLDNVSLFNLLVIGISTSLALSKIATRNAHLKSEAVAKQKEAELKYLKAQVNPHFLFNTLNTIYSLAATEDAPMTTEAILKLSEIMRYPLKDGSEKKVDLKDEIKFLTDYIDLQKIRIGEDYPIQFEVKGNLQDLKIAPLLFISFIENTFKYGVSQKNKKAILISIITEGKALKFQAKNKKSHSKNIESHKLGLQNVKARLELLYPNNHELNIVNTDEEYEVFLSLVL